MIQKRWITGITLLLFCLFTSAVFLPGQTSKTSDSEATSENSSQGSKSTQESNSESTSKKKKPKKEEAISLLNEVSKSGGEKPNIEILSRTYNLTPAEVEDAIAGLIGRGEISVPRVAEDNEAAARCLDLIHETLKAKSKALNRYDAGKSGN